MATTYTELLQIPIHEITDPFDITLINDSMTIIEKALGARSRVFNLLDNGDFLHPVNQRGAASVTTGWTYFIDRWLTPAASEATPITVNNSGLTIGNAAGTATISLRQYIEKFPDGTYTAAAYANDMIYYRTFTVADGSITQSQGRFDGKGQIYLSMSNGTLYYNLQAFAGYDITFKWAALYEGSYTAETLPEYQPKGYAAELIECMRYYIRYTTDTDSMFLPGGSNHNTLYATLHLPVPMRIDSPTVKYNNVNLYAYTAGSAITINGMTAPSNSATHGFVTLRVPHDTDAIAAGAPGCIRILAGGYIELSADL